MRAWNLVKICALVGAILAEIYMFFVILAPYRPGKAQNMFVPEYMVPKIEGMAPGTEPPLSGKITRLFVFTPFFLIFGAMAGTGVGLLLDGARRTFGFRKSAGSASPARDIAPAPEKTDPKP